MGPRGLVGLLVVGCIAGGPEPCPDRALDALDPRSPVALSPEAAWAQKQHMMGFLVAVQGTTRALATRDWDGVRAAAGPLGPRADTACGASEAASEPSLAERARRFRCEAAAIDVAAEARDPQAVLEALSVTLGHCNACHAAHRQRVTLR